MNEVPIDMTDKKAEVEKSNELQRRIRSTSLAPMENRPKDAKNVYFGMLFYDTEISKKHVEDLVKPVQRKQKTTGSSKDVKSAGSTKEAPMRSSAGVHRVLGQEDHSLFVRMENTRERLLAVVL